MHRSSESIAALAAALTKAQLQMFNPERLVIATKGADTPDSKARLRAVTVDRCAPRTPGIVSSRLTVANETADASARSRCSHRTRARAARMSSLVRVILD